MPSLEYELESSPENRAKLLQLREQDLAKLESEICSMQISLALQLNEQIEDLEGCESELNIKYANLQQILNSQTNQYNADKKCCALIELTEAISNSEQIMNGLEGLFQIFKHINSNSPFSKTSNILEVIHISNNLINKTKNYLPKLKFYTFNLQNTLCNTMIQNRYIDHCYINNVSRSIQQSRNNKKANKEQSRKNNKAKFSHQPPPNDPDPDPKDDDDPLPIDNPSIMNHIFRDSPSHFKQDTPKYRALLRQLVRNIKNLASKTSDRNGNHWFSKITKEGKQLWARCRNGKVTNGGINNKPKEYHPLYEV